MHAAEECHDQTLSPHSDVGGLSGHVPRLLAHRLRLRDAPIYELRAEDPLQRSVVVLD